LGKAIAGNFVLKSERELCADPFAIGSGSENLCTSPTSIEDALLRAMPVLVRFFSGSEKSPKDIARFSHSATPLLAMSMPSTPSGPGDAGAGGSGDGSGPGVDGVLLEAAEGRASPLFDTPGSGFFLFPEKQFFVSELPI
jgi:hypothetical protein